MQTGYTREKALLMLMATLLLGMAALAGFFDGQQYTIREIRAEVHDGMVMFDLDGQTYVHLL